MCHRWAGQGRTHADGPRVRVLSVSPQKRRKLGPGWVESGQKTDKSPFASARWAVWFIRFIPNKRVRIGRSRAVELASLPVALGRMHPCACVTAGLCTLLRGITAF